MLSLSWLKYHFYKPDSLLYNNRQTVKLKLFKYLNRYSRFLENSGWLSSTKGLLGRLQLAFQDKSLQCSDCGTTFTFSAREQEFFSSKGYTNEPKRCSQCRQARKAGRSGNSDYGFKPQRQMFSVVCAQCGKDTEVPFEPREGRPVYCSECYNLLKVNR